jgi:hypothetical protein
MSAVVYFAHGARVRGILGLILSVVLLSVLDSKRLSQTAVWHHFWHRGGFLGTEFGTGNFTWRVTQPRPKAAPRGDVRSKPTILTCWNVQKQKLTTSFRYVDRIGHWRWTIARLIIPIAKKVQWCHRCTNMMAMFYSYLLLFITLY